MVTVSGELHEVQRASTPIERVVRAHTWREALGALRSFPGARPLAGGTDLLLDLARSHEGPVTLVDLSVVDGGDVIVDEGASFLLGGRVTHNQIVGDPRLREHCLPLAQACLEIGSPQLRNRATIAGNLATASPANDSISALMALDATVVLSRLGQGPAGDAPVITREVDVAGFFTGFRTTVCGPDELITGIRVPKLTADQRGLWVKVGLRRAQAISVVHAGMVVEVRDGRVIDARLALGSVAPTVIVSHVFPAALLDRRLDDATIAATARSVAASITPIDDVRATADYRTAVTEAVIARALHTVAAGEVARAWPTEPPLLRVRTPSAHASAEATPGATGDATVTDETEISVRVNGEMAGGSAAASTTLLDWLRDHSSVACSGVKEGCAEGECGACTVQIDGAAAMACLINAAQADGADIVTVEGLGSGERHPLQEAFIDEFAVQCGFCIPGFLVAGATLLDEHPAPTDEQIELGLAGNLCRCTGYYPISAAVRAVAAKGEKR
jgi:xanthine dehydrogenase iron-sulfur cluster and FAD-binding subunit A